LNRILADIKAVQGVTGVAIVDLEKSVTYRLLPAHLDNDQVRRLGVTLFELSQKTKEPIRLDLKFDNGMAVLVKLNLAAIFVYGRPSLNQSLLKLVLKSSVSAIERRLAGGSETRQASYDRTSPTSALDYVETLVKAANQIALSYGKYVGIYLVGQRMRQAREELLAEFPFLANFCVGNDGSVTMIQGKEISAGDNLVLGFARWLSLLGRFCRKVSPVVRDLGVSQLTKEWADKLEEMGFYQLYEN